jgi:H+/Cl- antiporter ClcA
MATRSQPARRSRRPGRPSRRGTAGWFLALATLVTLWLYAGPVTPSGGQIVPSVFMGAIQGLILTVIIRFGFQRRPPADR